MHLMLKFTNEMEALTNGSHTHVGILLSGFIPKSGNWCQVVVEVTGLYDCKRAVRSAQHIADAVL